jgi:hypothetical protein
MHILMREIVYAQALAPQHACALRASHQFAQCLHLQDMPSTHCSHPWGQQSKQALLTAPLPIQAYGIHRVNFLQEGLYLQEAAGGAVLVAKAFKTRLFATTLISCSKSCRFRSIQTMLACYSSSAPQQSFSLRY